MHFFFFFVLLPLNTFSQNPIPFNNQEFIYFGYNSEIYEDKEGASTIHFVSTRAKFRKHTSNVFSIVNCNSTYWIRVTLKNQTDNELLLLKDLAQTTSVSLFKQVERDSFVHQSIGNHIPFYLRKYKTTPYVFDLNLQKNEKATYYLKVKGDELMNIPFFVVNKETAYEYLLNKELFFGIFIGVMLIVFFYNFFIFLSTKDNSFLFYVIYIFNISLTLLSINDYTLKYLWPDSQFMADNDTIIFGSLSIFSIFLFLVNFLESKVNHPKFYAFLRNISPLCFLPFVFILIDERVIAYQLINFFNLTTCIIVFVYSLMSLISGYKPARFFFVGWGIMVSFSSVFALTNFAFFENNFFTFNSIIIGVTIESFLISFALADKINHYKEKSLIAINEKKILLSSQKEYLEELVETRTEEIKENYLKIKHQKEEKEVLLREVHHRVKNNLQIITSLLSLQKLNLKDKKIMDIFTVSQHRINSMAIIHEMIYQNDSLSGINYKDYLNKLINEIVNTYCSADKNIDIQINSDNYILNLNTAITLGLIVNEIITNSMKYGFKDKSNGVISASLNLNSENIYCLKIGDDGVGLPKSYAWKTTNTLGMKLINKLSVQIDADIILDTSKTGTNYIISFHNS